jgi:hypothetical protein
MLIFYIYDFSGMHSLIKLSFSKEVKAHYCSECIWLVPETWSDD